MKAVISANPKGGTGKTLTAINLALILNQHGKVGILDADLDSSNLYDYLGLTEKMTLDEDRTMIPIEYEGIKVFSMGGFLPVHNKGVSISGEAMKQMIFDAVNNVEWGELDYLVVDAPAGTSKERFVALRDALEGSLLGIVITTQPNIKDDVRRLYDLCARHRIRILGLIENMRTIVCSEGHPLSCPLCNSDGDNTDPFGSGGEELAEELEMEYFGSIPLSRRIREKPILPSWALAPINNAVEKIIKEEVYKKKGLLSKLTGIFKK